MIPAGWIEAKACSRKAERNWELQPKHTELRGGD